MLRFAAVRSEAVMSIDNASIEFDFRSLLAANVEIVAWDGKEGQIEYNDRPRVMEGFTDPSPYNALINGWLNAAVVAPQPLTLAQARKIKLDFIEAIFVYKRKVPYTYVGHNWPTDDESMLMALTAMSRWAASNPEITNLKSVVNNIIRTYARADAISWEEAGSWTVQSSGPASFDTGNAALQGMAIAVSGQTVYSPSTIYRIDGRMNYLRIWTPAWALYYPTRGGVPDASSYPNVNNVPGMDDPVLLWESLSTGTAVRLTFAQASGLLTGISNRNETLLTTKLSKRAQINAFVSMANLIAFDVLSGW